MNNVIILNYKIQIFIINFTIKILLEGDSLFIQLDKNKKNNKKLYIYFQNNQRREIPRNIFNDKSNF